MPSTTTQTAINIKRLFTILLERQGFRMILAVLLFPLTNALLNKLVVHTSIPLFLDSSLTGVAAILGLPYGLATAVLTNLHEEILNGFSGHYLPFALCGMTTALIVWLLARRQLLQTPLHAGLGIILVTLANSVLGAIIATWVFGGGTGSNIDMIVAGFVLAFENILSAAFLGRLVVNTIDKAPAVLLAVLFNRWLKKREADTRACSTSASTR